MNGRSLRLGCLASGAGRTVRNLLEESRAGRMPAEVAVVIATRAGVGAVEMARAAGVPAEEILPAVPGVPDPTIDDRVDECLRRHRVDLVCLCGYLRRFRVGAWAGRVINIHPALLPRHGGAGMYGHHVHRAVLAAGDRESGCTVHFVDDEYDHGPPILARRCPVLPGDTPESLAARVFEEECRALPEAIRMLAAYPRA